VRQFVNIDYRGTMTLLALHGDSPESTRLLAMGQYLRCLDGRAAEFAFVTTDDYQSRGLATWMFLRLIEHARQNGFHRFVGDVLLGNPAMLRVLEKVGMPLKKAFADGVHLIEIDLQAGRSDPPPD
jgi:RimJ/RimL family protein N-acetyltransferase